MKRSILILAWLGVVLAFGPAGAAAMERHDVLDGLSARMDVHAIDAKLDARSEDRELAPSISAETFREVVALTRAAVLPAKEQAMARTSADKVGSFSLGLFWFSLLGLGLLAIPLIAKDRPFKYCAIAAATVFVTINLFGVAMLGMKVAPSPSRALASGTFDTLHDNAEDYTTLGKELFVPTLMAIDGRSDAQPAVSLIDNGTRIVADAKIFASVARMVNKLDGAFATLPITLFVVTLVLFALAIRPTLTAIIAAETTDSAMRQARGHALATACTVGVLAVLAVVSSLIIARIMGPAADALLGYFSLAVSYLRFIEGASSGLVFLTLFSVVLFLALTFGTLVLTMSFFLGTCQKVFRAHFIDGTPLSANKRFFQWGVPAVLFVQLFPLAYVLVAEKILDTINASLLASIQDADQVSWTKLMLAGPIVLVVAYALIFWGARGFRAIGFLLSYKAAPAA